MVEIPEGPILSKQVIRIRIIKGSGLSDWEGGGRPAGVRWPKSRGAAGLGAPVYYTTILVTQTW